MQSENLLRTDYSAGIYIPLTILPSFNPQLQDTDLCRLCIETAETPLHLFCSCPALMHIRSILLMKYIIHPDDAKFLPARKVLLFLAATNACWEITIIITGRHGTRVEANLCRKQKKGEKYYHPIYKLC
ncbi:jg815 [Pararge aegeria aegeria]|uniref:Jg815 protein n=1 Tax=Pararge aegeria aegeria TaxID=348720 RepID=A0A8S4QMM7_9NEOP|nr:jg815 [Pararge aegeria aegeria]